MEEEDKSIASEPIQYFPSPQPISLCKCLISTESSQEEIISERKKLILSTVARTENYLRERRIPELMRYFLAKVIASRDKNPAAYGAKLLDKCMIYRAGHGVAPVIYEKRHLEAVVKSFDPGERGWLSAAQVRRAFTTLGLTPDNDLPERIPTDVVLNNLIVTQEYGLFRLVSAGVKPSELQSQSNSTM